MFLLGNFYFRALFIWNIFDWWDCISSWEEPFSSEHFIWNFWQQGIQLLGTFCWKLFDFKFCKELFVCDLFVGNIFEWWDCISSWEEHFSLQKFCWELLAVGNSSVRNLFLEVIWFQVFARKFLGPCLLVIFLIDGTTSPLERKLFPSEHFIGNFWQL